MLDDPNAKTTISEPPRRRNPFEVALPLEEEPAPLDPPPTGPRRRAERTEVVESPLRGGTVPWTANPMIWIAGVFAAFVAGAVVVFVMVRTMMPSQPVVVQAPPPVVVHEPAAPVVTQPVVTPLEPKAEAAKAEPVVTALPDASEIPPAPKAHRGAKHAAKKDLSTKDLFAAPSKPAAATAKPTAAASKPAATTAKADAPQAKKSAKASAPSDDDDDDSPPAAPKKAAAQGKKTEKKAESKPKGGDWVDPFAQ
jgi:hypothetical protein